jgi:type II secretory pathway component PulK
MKYLSAISFKSVKTARNARSGYALIVVLFSLTVLTLIFGTASTRTLTHVQRNHSNLVLAKQFETRAATAELLLDLGSQTLFDPESQVWQLQQLQGITLQPATGLVDLNTASPALLRLLLEGYELPDVQIREALEAYRTWRRQGRKLLRVSDFYRAAGLTADVLPKLASFATVYSGRTGITLEQAPTDLLQRLLGSDEPQEVLVERFDQALVTNGSMVNLHVRGEMGMQIVLHLGGAVDSRILNLHK